MFTGIVEEAGRVEFLNEGRLRIKAERVLEDLAQGDSISVNGACLTAVLVNSKAFEVDLVPETLRRTNLGVLEQGSTVNLERSLAANARLGGHIVQGHVDAAAKISSMEAEVDAVNVRIEAPQGLMRYIVEKGFIAVDGISLTVVKAFSSSFTTSVIPYTRQNTNLRGRKVGDLVNLEVDILAKYVESLLTSQGRGSPEA